MNNSDIEIVITSYNRWHLLNPCLTSLLNIIGHKYKVTVIEDSTKPEMKEKILSHFGGRVNLIFNDENLGQVKSIDKAYSTVTSKYILKVEDDYFFSGNHNFIKEAIEILETNSEVNNVFVRKPANFIVSHGPNYANDLFEKPILHTASNVPYKMFNKLHCGDWCGFTFMPHIHRTEDYRKMFPQGYFAVSQAAIGVMGEKACNDHVRDNFPFRAAILVNGVCETKHNETTYK